MLGAGGRLGSRVLAECVRQGHQATAFVRSSDRLRAAVGDQLLRAVAVVEGDALDADALRAAMSGQEACVQVRCAGRVLWEDGQEMGPRRQGRRLPLPMQPAADAARVQLSTDNSALFPCALAGCRLHWEDV